MTATAPVATAATTDVEIRQLEIRMELATDEILEYHRTHRPANTTRNYVPKQKEWRVRHSHNRLYMVEIY